ncbi:capsid portal protein [Sphingomonas xinjiangensis]|uniref:Capsid portal protein n=1 Tax=Sphingomonas xinjiangensis TaxID=643568 RepID=A0A840YRW4_9SPHN|nr:capsid portal protein [Sphingomonas xinjiangensis]
MLNRETYNHAPELPRILLNRCAHLERCMSCGRWFDTRDLFDVLRHDLQPSEPAEAH